MRSRKVDIQNRQREIINLLRQRNTLTIGEISNLFKVSEITVRRDLDYLAATNMIERFRGAARLKQNTLPEVPLFSDKREKFKEEKERIAKKAVERIESGDVIFVNSGSTVLFLLKFIYQPDVKIVTNNARMATAEGEQNVNLIITGGERYAKTQSLVGDIALYALSRINANKCILSVNGISAEYGITSSFHLETAVNEMMLNRCNGERIVIADSSKVGRSFSFVSAGIEKIDTLITDRKADAEEIKKLIRTGVDVVFADDEQA